MAQQISLKAAVRELTGKSVKRLRRDGYVPAVLYGPETENQNLVIKKDELLNLLKTSQENAVVVLAVEDKQGKKDYRVLLHDLTRDPISQEITHLDLYRFSAKKKVVVHIPLVLKGVSHAEELNAVLLQNLDKLEAECLPDAIPEKIEVEISGLVGLDQTLYVKDLKLPAGVEAEIDEDTPVVSLVPVKEEVIEAEPQPLVEPELAGKEKKAEEEAAPAAGSVSKESKE